jgi:PKD repeat protein
MKRALVPAVILFATLLLAFPRESISQDQGVSMLFASDTQFPWWRTGQDPNCNSDDCVKQMAVATNGRLVSAMKDIKAIGRWPDNINCYMIDRTSCVLPPIGGLPITTPSGLIINGDLTAYFHASEFGAFGFMYYLGLLTKYQIYPGLGNHDYKNNVDKGPGVSGGAFGGWGDARYGDALVYAYDYDRNAKEAVWFMANQIEVMPNIVNKDVSAFVSLENKGGFDARLRADYYLNGTYYGESDAFEVEQRRAIVIPRQATNVNVQIEEWTGFDWTTVNTYHFGQAVRACFEVTGTTYAPGSAATPCINEWPSRSYGSLAYSFDIGNFHFVQLQYRPDYQHNLPPRTITGPVTTYEIDDSPGFTVTSSYAWLMQDLTAATAAGKSIVLNMHDAIATDCAEGGNSLVPGFPAWSWNPCNQGKLAVKDDPEFLQAITNQNVVAIFAGHLHDQYGLVNDYVVSDRGTKKIPIFLSGAAEYERFLLADFHRKYFTVAVINSSSGQPVLVEDEHDLPAGTRAYTAPVAFEINRPPVLSAWLETARLLEGSPVSFRAAASDPDGDEVTVTWRFGDGATATGLTPSHTYADNKTYTVVVVADDGYGGKASTTLEVPVENVPPTITAEGMTIDESQVATVQGTITDPGIRDTFDLTIDWRDGGPVEAFSVGTARSYSRSHRYLDDNPTATPVDTYAIHVTIKDKDGGSRTADTSVTVRNVAPTTHIDSLIDDAGQDVGPSDPVLVLLALTSHESYSDVGSQDVLTATRSWGDATPVENLGVVAATTSGAHTYQQEGTYQLTVVVTDDDTGVSSAARPVRVTTPSGATTQAINDLAQLTSNNPAATRALNDALDALRGQNGGTAADGALGKLAKGDNQAALDKLGQAIPPLETAEAADPALHLVKLKSLLTLTAKSVAVGSISRAEARASNDGQRKQVAAAKDLLAQGQSLLTGRDYASAIKRFRDVLDKTSFAKDRS